MSQLFLAVFPRLARAWLLVIAVVLSRSVAFAADSKPSEPNTVKLSLYPALPPAAALEYSLLPKFIDRTAGNAAPLYLKAIVLMAHNRQTNEFQDKLDHWLTVPPAELPQDEVRTALLQFQSTLWYVKIAAHRDHCDWDPPLRESKDPFAILLPEIQDLRGIGRILALQARLQIAEGHPVEAIDTLQIGFTLAQHASDGGFLISELVGQAIANSMTDQLETLIQSKHCPNLYWTLAALPQPFIDFRPGLDIEGASIFLEFPQLRDVEHAQRTPEEWQAILGGFVQKWNGTVAEMNSDITSAPKQLAATIAMAAVMSVGYPKAKAGLIAAGRDQKRVEAMPAAQAILAYAVLCLDRTRDDGSKWYGLPYWQAHEGIAQAERQLKSNAAPVDIFALANQLLPALGKVRETQVRSERRMAALRIVESIRMYAASHDGKLPARLDDLTDAPAPIDPETGEPFAYTMADGKAVLEGDHSFDNHVLRYELTIAATKK